MAAKFEIDFDKIYETKRGEKYKIIESLGPQMQSNGKRVTKVKIQFLESKFIREATLTDAVHGVTADPYFKDVCGVACKGEIEKGYDVRIYNVWYKMISRCYNPKDNAYKRYGYAGITVCDRWLIFANFYEDYKILPGYKEYEQADFFEKRKYNLDKDFRQQGLDYNQKVYGPTTCCILKAEENSRLASRDKAERANKYIGVSKQYNDMYKCEVMHNTVTYFIGLFTNELAAASAYNCIARLMGITILNQITEMPIIEWVGYRINDINFPIGVPYGITLPKSITDYIPILYGNTKYAGVEQLRSDCFRAFYNETTIGYYVTDYAAASARVNYCNENHLFDDTGLSQDKYINPDELHKYQTVDPNLRDQILYNDKMMETINSKIHIGDRFKNSEGDEYEVLEIGDPARYSYLKVPVKIRFIKSGYETTVISKNIERGLNIIDRTKPTVFGFGYLGMDDYERNPINTKIYNCWYRILQRATTLFPNNPAEHVEERWHSFKNFLEDCPTLENYLLFINNPNNIVVLGVLKHQLNIPQDQRIFSRQTCYFIWAAGEDKYKYMDTNKNPYNYSNIIQTNTGNYKAYWSNPYRQDTIRSTYTNQIAAANAVNYHSQFLYGMSPNNVPYMPYEEWIKYRIGNIHPLYSLTNINNSNKDLLCIPTYESEESRNTRCKERYGIEFL